jgi:hypothetical protein
VHDRVAGVYEVISVPAPPIVADAGPSSAVVARLVKWFAASVAVLWQFVQLLWAELIP